MKYKVLLFKESQLLNVFQYDLVQDSFELIDSNESNWDEGGLAIVIFSSDEYVTIPVEIPPNLNMKQLDKAVNTIISDEPIFGDENFVYSLPDSKCAGLTGIGVMPKDLFKLIEEYESKFFILSILPIEALLGVFLKEGRFIIKDAESFLYIEIKNSLIEQSYWFKDSDIELIESLELDGVSKIEASQLSWSKLLKGLQKIVTNSSHRHNLDFCRNSLKTSNVKSLVRSLSHLTTSMKYLVVLGLTIFFGNLFYHSILYGVTAFYSNKFIGVTSSSEANSRVLSLQGEISKLERDISQLSVLNYHNVFTTLAALSKILSTPIDSFFFDPPKVRITGTAKEYAPVETLKKELMKEREVFCGVKLEDLKDVRNQKKFSFELSLCKG